MQPTTTSKTKTKSRKKPGATSQMETDRELKAYIYQQLVELQPYLVADSQMAVSVQQVMSAKNPAPSPADLSADQTDGDANSGASASAMDADMDDADNEHSPQPGDYVVKLTTTLDEGKLIAEGFSTNVYEAFISAKAVMVDQLAQLQNAIIDQSDRDEEVQSYLDGSRTLH